MKRDNTKEAKFFCESCGSEVPRQSKFCPTCGKFFASVKCPRCGKIGTNDDFKNGCPDCGYAVNNSYVGIGIPKNKKIKDSFFFEYENDSKKYNSKKRKGYEDSAVPFWLPVVCIAILMGLLVGLWSCLSN